MSVIGYLVTWLLLVAYGTVINGWTLYVLWGWFIEREFGLPALTFVPATGLALVISYLTVHVSTKKDERSFPEIAQYGFLGATLKTLIYLGVGLCIKQFL